MECGKCVVFVVGGCTEFELHGPHGIVAKGTLVVEGDICSSSSFAFGYCMMKITEIVDTKYRYGKDKRNLNLGDIVRWRKTMAFSKDYGKGTFLDL